MSEQTNSAAPRLVGKSATTPSGASQDALDLSLVGMLPRLGALIIVALVAAVISGALVARSWSPQDIFAVFARQVPAAIDFQLNKIHQSFLEYDILQMIGTLGFLMIIMSAATLLIFEIAYVAIRDRSIRESWHQSSTYRLIFGEESERTDLYLYLYYCFSLDRFVLAALGLLGPFFIYGLILSEVNIGLATDWPPLLQFLAFILVADFINYWFHRVAHNLPALWELHKFHHSATSMNFITAHRNHPFEVSLQLPLRALPIVLIAPNVQEYVLYTAIHHFVILLQHSNFNFKFGPLEPVFVSPNFHLTHHSIKLEHCDKNYGVLFSFWDDLFGTRYRGDEPVRAYGVSRSYFNRRGFWYDIAQPFVRFANAILRGGRVT